MATDRRTVDPTDAGLSHTSDRPSSGAGASSTKRPPDNEWIACGDDSVTLVICNDAQCAK